MSQRGGFQRLYQGLEEACRLTAGAGSMVECHRQRQRSDRASLTMNEHDFLEQFARPMMAT